jgi:arginyl-tRNA synthetase
MTKNSLITAIQAIVLSEFSLSESVELTRPDIKFGDYATNIPMKLSKQLKMHPRAIAETILESLSSNELIDSIDIAGPGFLNLKLNNRALWRETTRSTELLYQDENIVTEYSDPNVMKDLHAGHLYTTIIGDVVSRLIEKGGASVHRTNFGGDVGLHVAKAMWGILKNLDGENLEGLKDISTENRTIWLSQCYVSGAKAYDEDEAAKIEITKLNKRVYEIHNNKDSSSDFAKIYWAAREWSYDGFKTLYDRLGTNQFEKYYPESVTTPPGLAAVKTGLEKGIFEESDGAIVYKGEDKGLHTRVFLNSQGLPTYEAKDLGLTYCKWEDYSYDRNIIITGNDITEYMKVVLAALAELLPETEGKTTHLTHGMIKMKGGVKMSSRKGNVLRGFDMIDAAEKAARFSRENESQPAWLAIGALKYSLLKQRIGGDIIYDPEDSVSLEGNSGPYLMYAHARASSILRKAKDEPVTETTDFEPAERTMVQQLKHRGVAQLARASVSKTEGLGFESRHPCQLKTPPPRWPF